MHLLSLSRSIFNVLHGSSDDHCHTSTFQWEFGRATGVIELHVGHFLHFVVQQPFTETANACSLNLKRSSVGCRLEVILVVEHPDKRVLASDDEVRMTSLEIRFQLLDQTVEISYGTISKYNPTRKQVRKVSSRQKKLFFCHRAQQK